MRWSVKFALLAVVVSLGFWSPGVAGESTTFDRMVAQYEAVRLALLHDGTDDVAGAAHHIHRLAAELEDSLDPQTAGISPENVEELREILPSIQESSSELAKAAAISEARESFGALSKALVQYRRLVTDPTPAVAFCSMAQKVWLQPSGEIGNPYYGQSMARCGEFVSK